jgi:branched-chain amino acid transport system ATP-binding protein
MPLLDVRDVSVSYGQINAVRNASLAIDEREIVTLIGANGAGKSSLINAICGLRSIAERRVIYDGQDLATIPAHRLPTLGLVQVPEGRRIFGRLTVMENLALGGYCRKIGHVEREGRLQEIFTLFPRLNERRQQLAGTLSGGEQQMLAIGRALMAGPRLLLLDEPSMGLAPRVADQIFAAIATIAERGVAILLVEQNAYIALELAKRAYVMEAGSIVMEGPAADFLKDDRIKTTYLG